MKTSDVSSMLVAFFLALGVAGFVYFLQSKPHVLAESTAQNTLKILVAKLDLKPGERIDVNKFQWVEWPTSSVHDDYYTEEDVKTFDDINNMVVRYEILEGEPLKKGDLVAADGKSILAAFISPNMKAVSVPLKKVANANAHISPGDYIDIILPQRRGKNQSADTVLNGIKVLAVDNKFFTPEGEAAETIAKNISLEVTAEQAEALAISIAHGQIVISYHSAYTPNPDVKVGVKKVVKPKKITVDHGIFQ